MERHCAAIEHRIVPKLTQDYGALGDDEWRRQYDEVNAFGEEHFRIVRWGMTIYNGFLHALLERLLASWCGDDSGELYQNVIGGLDDTKTATINTEIVNLAQVALDDGEVADFVRAGGAYHDARESTADAEFWRHYDEFLVRHGHRSDSRDIGRPRWREQPHLILELVRAQLRATGMTAPQSNSSHDRRIAAEEAALAELGRGPTRWVRASILIRLMALVQDYTRYRENQRYHLDYLLTHLRALVLEQAGRLVRRGVLGDRDDVFLLRGTEFFSAIAGRGAGVDLSGELETRRNELARNAGRLPATYLFDDVEAEVHDQSSASSVDLPEGSIGGTAFCRGQASGRARVVHTLSELGTVEAGDILVAPNIDPGWTSVFPLLAGLVVETGGRLSHGAILSREYGIPAVGGITGATTVIADRADVAVDGHRGTVTLGPCQGS